MNHLLELNKLAQVLGILPVNDHSITRIGLSRMRMNENAYTTKGKPENGKLLMQLISSSWQREFLGILVSCNLSVLLDKTSPNDRNSSLVGAVQPDSYLSIPITKILPHNLDHYTLSSSSDKKPLKPGSPAERRLFPYCVEGTEDWMANLFFAPPCDWSLETPSALLNKTSGQQQQRCLGAVLPCNWQGPLPTVYACVSNNWLLLHPSIFQGVFGA